MFLLTRIREGYDARRQRAAPCRGLAASARIITSAAAIMVVVFARFALTGAPTIKEVGVGLAVAIAIDATDHAARARARDDAAAGRLELVAARLARPPSAPTGA